MPLRIIHSLRVQFSADRELFKSLKIILGFYPSNISLYKQAFRHRSASQEIKQGVRNSNERLEYLGDAVLSSVVAHYLFSIFPYKDEGFLTKMRSRLVSRYQLNLLANKMGINRLTEKNIDISLKDSSIYGDAFEALIGAVYLDKGYAVARSFVMNRVIRLHVNIEEVENSETDFKSRIMEWSQKEKKEVKFLFTEETSRNGKEKVFSVQLLIDSEEKGKGLHFSKRRAEQIAAEEACLKLSLL